MRERRARTGRRSAPIGQTSRATSWSSLPLFSSMPFEQSTSGRSRPAPVRAPARICCAGVTTSQASQPFELGKIGRRADRLVERDAGQEDGVLVAVVDRLDDLGLDRPQQGFAAAGRGDLRQRGAPGAAADDPELHAFTPAPRTFSALLVERPARPRRHVERIAHRRRRSAPRRPRRSSPHCRCTARRAGR